MNCKDKGRKLTNSNRLNKYIVPNTKGVVNQNKRVES